MAPAEFYASTQGIAVDSTTAAIMERHRASVATVECISCGTRSVPAHWSPEYCFACAPTRPIIVGRTNHHPAPWEHNYPMTIGE